jgi:hypothetical protein
MPRGGKKRADAIQVGDRLWARDEFDPAGPLALKEVEEVFVRSAPLWNLHVAGQRLKTTAEHPFYVVGQGWVPAGMLRIGDRLLTQDGRAVPVEGVAPSGQRATVYNWRIAEYHTYYVSAAETSPSLWAHNADYNVGAGASEAPASTQSTLTSAAQRANAAVGAGRGPVHGTRVHSAFEAEVRALGRTDLTPEVSYLNGDVVRRGMPGSIRLDVVEGPLSAPTAVYDLKTGSATLTPGRIAEIRSHLPNGGRLPDGSLVPVIEIR